MNLSPLGALAAHRHLRVLLVALVLLGSSASALRGQVQTGSRSADNIWQVVTERPAGVADRSDITGQFAIVRLNREALEARLAQAPRDGDPGASVGVEMTLPMPDGSFARFRVVESPILAPELAAAFPEIKTYHAQGIDDPTATSRFGWTGAGFHSIVLSESGTVYVDPYTAGNLEYFISFRKHDLQRLALGFICLTDGSRQSGLNRTEGQFPITNGTELRTYRLALAATAEYTAAAGGTKAQALDRMTTTMNRVNGIYERELAVRMTMITGPPGNLTALIYDGDPASDPYSNLDGFEMLGQNQTNLDNIMGSAAYDIGHVFSTGGGGIASLRSPCSIDRKAQGVTGLSDPTGDAFDVDFVSHEIGHQFGGNHTFNGTAGNCDTRAALHAFEVGSGSTIQAYAGICGAENLQRNSHAYFHVESLNEMTAFLTSGGGATCGTGSPTGNTPPSVSTTAAATIPMGTPFALTATASDVNGDAVTYTWEQYDLGTQSSDVSSASTDDGTRPLFRSYEPTSSAARTFPSLTYILNNANAPPTTYTCSGATCLTGEVLPSVNRTMNFRVTARDNRSGGGAITTASAAVTVHAAAGPFQVTAPNTAVSYIGGSTQTVTWDKNGTDAAPISTANVKISLSTDGGTTFPTVLVASTPNDGSHAVVLPDSATTAARIKVEAVDNIYFDISNVNFTIVSSTSPPGAPTGVSAVAGDAQAVVSFTPPTDSGGSAIVNYTVTASPGGATATGAASPITVTGLTNGTSYTFTVTATNATGTSAASTASSAVTPAAPITVPGAPTGVSAVAGTGQAAVSFAAPASNGGAAITGYTVTASPGGTTASGTSSPITVTGLTNGTAYTFTVTAANSAGTSAASTASAPVTPLPAIGAPTNFAASAILGNDVTLTWTAGAGINPITSYVLEGGLTPGSVLGTLPIATTGTTFTATLPTGAFYLRLYALAGATRSAVSNEIRVYVNVPAPPSTPSNLLGLVNGTSIGLAWVNTAGGGSPTAILLDVSGPVTTTLALPVSETFAAVNVPAGTYTFAVRAANDTGTSSASSPLTLTFPGACSGAPLAPVALTVSKSGNTLTVTWMPPASGAAPASYTLNVSGAFNISLPTTGRSLSGTVGAGSYTMSVTASNACGTSAATPAQTVVVP